MCSKLPPQRTAPLFRDAALQGRLGDIGVPPEVAPLWSRIFAFGLIATIIALGLLITFGSYARKARVSGFLKEIAYQDGAPVKKGTHLFTIEPEPYQLKLQQAQAAEAGAEATATQALAEFDRQQELVSRQAASKTLLQARSKTTCLRSKSNQRPNLRD